MSEKHPPIPESTKALRDPRLGRPPFWMMTVIVLSAVASWIPLVAAARGRVASSPEPRIAFVQDMATQPKYGPQQATPLFLDGRIMRPRVTGTVARGQLEEDDHYYRGFARTPAGADGKPGVKFFDGYPDGVKVTPDLLARGQERFNIYCAACHGRDGYGRGPVNERANELQLLGQATWVPAANLHDATVWARPNGHVFNTITNGIRSMPPYGGQIPPADRWAIVAYVRALELSQSAPADAAPAGQLDGAK